MLKFLFSIILMTVLALAAPSGTSAAQEVECGHLVLANCGGPTHESKHYFYDEAPRDNEVCEGCGAKSEFHDTCNVCRHGGYMVPAEWCHPECAASEEDEDTQQALLQLWEGASVGDVALVLAIAPQVPKYASISSHRRAIQVKDCKDRVVANLPLGPLYHDAVAAFSGDDWDGN